MAHVRNHVADILRRPGKRVICINASVAGIVYFDILWNSRVLGKIFRLTHTSETDAIEVHRGLANVLNMLPGTFISRCLLGAQSESCVCQIYQFHDVRYFR